MEIIIQKAESVKKALISLNVSIDLEHKFANKSADKDLLKALRDSSIQRLEYCVDQLWKLIKLYLEDIEKVELDLKSPKAIIRKAAQIGFLSEKESEDALLILDARNQTSHIYKEELAEFIDAQIPSFYELMQAIFDRIENKIKL